MNIRIKVQFFRGELIASIAAFSERFLESFLNGDGSGNNDSIKLIDVMTDRLKQNQKQLPAKLRPHIWRQSMIRKILEDDNSQSEQKLRENFKSKLREIVPRMEQNPMNDDLTSGPQTEILRQLPMFQKLDEAMLRVLFRNVPTMIKILSQLENVDYTFVYFIYVFIIATNTGEERSINFFESLFFSFLFIKSYFPALENIREITQKVLGCFKCDHPEFYDHFEKLCSVNAENYTSKQHTFEKENGMLSKCEQQLNFDNVAEKSFHRQSVTKSEILILSWLNLMTEKSPSLYTQLNQGHTSLEDRNYLAKGQNLPKTIDIQGKRNRPNSQPNLKTFQSEIITPGKNIQPSNADQNVFSEEMITEIESENNDKISSSPVEFKSPQELVATLILEGFARNSIPASFSHFERT